MNGPSLAISLKTLTHCRNVASLSLFYRNYFARYSCELFKLVSLPFSRRGSDRLHNFFVTIPRCYKDVYVNSCFPRAVQLWNSLPIECFPLMHDLKVQNQQTPINCGFFLKKITVCFNLFMLLFLVTRSLEVAVQPCIE